MRIDTNPGAQPLPDAPRSGEQTPAKNAAAGAPGISNPLGEDEAQLSGVHMQVQALVAQASKLPETSQEKVNALRQAVVSGTYQPRPDQVAAALFANMVKSAA
jgi:flagellar biosynthesis anti-sigma factor FlgM